MGLGLALIVTWGLRWREIKKRPLNWGLGLLSLGMILSAFFASNSRAAFLGLGNFIPFFVLFAALSSFIQTPAQLRRLAWLMVLPSPLVSVLGLGQILLGWQTPDWFLPLFGWTLLPGGNPPGRMASVFMYTNILSAYLMVVLILGMGLGVGVYRNWRRKQPQAIWIGLGLTGLLILDAIALILTSSRNAWGVTGLALIIFAIYLGRYWVVGGFGIVIALVLWAAYGIPPSRDWLREIVPAYFWARLTDQLYPDRPLETLRTTQWQFAWDLTLDRPGLGWGLRNFTPLYLAQWDVWLGHPHNLFLMLTAEIGIPLTLLFSGLVAGILWRGFQLLHLWLKLTPTPSYQWREDRIIIFAFLLAFCSVVVFNLFDVTLFDFRVNLLAWIILSAIAGVLHYHHGLFLWQELGQRR